MTLVYSPDLEMWATSFLRSQLASHAINAEVSNKEPATLKTPLPRPLIIIRDDSGPRDSPITFTRSIGISILGGTPQDDYDTKTLARTVTAILTDHDTVALAAGSPVVSVNGTTGPYSVADPQNVTRMYSTVEYTVVGSW